MAQFRIGPTSKIALVAATAKVVLYFKAGANQPVKIKRLRLDFDGVDFTKTKVKVEIGRWTSAVTPSGGTSLTPVSKASLLSANVSNMAACATGPTTPGTDATNSISTFYVDEFGIFDDRIPLGDEDEVGKGEYWFCRVTSTDAVNVMPLLEVDE